MSNQRGATLAVALLMLLIITLLGVSTIQVTHMEEKMTANLQDKELSFRAAESALAAGETWLLALTTEPTVTTICTAFPCVQELYQNMNYVTQTTAWWQANSANYATSLDNVATTPRYIIEFVQFVPDSPVVGVSNTSSSGVFYYQVTARGSGSTNDSLTVLQTTVARRF